MKNNLQVRTLGNGPDLVLLHGWGLNSGVWQSLAEKLKNDFRIHLVDLPGYGINCGLVPEHYDLDTLAQMVAEKLPSQSRLLGWSLGGLVAQKIATTSSVQIERLILVASSPKFVAEPPDWPGTNAEVLKTFKDKLSVDIDKTVERFLAVQALGSPSMRADIKALQLAISGYPSASEIALKRGLDILSSVDLRADVDRINVPVIRIYGAKDSLVPKASIDAIKAYDRAAQIKIFERSSHAPFISEIAEFCDFLIKNA